MPARRRSPLRTPTLLLLALVLAVLGSPALPAAAAGEPVVTTFDDQTTGPWTQSGGPVLGFVDDGKGGRALQVGGRTADFDGIQSPTGLLVPGQEHTFSMRVRLAPGTPGTAPVRFVVKPAYTWVGATTMSADAWTQVTGTYTAPAGADPATLQVYLGTGALSGGEASYSYLVDDLSIGGTTGGGGEDWVPTPDPTFVPGGAVDPTTTPVQAARGTGNVTALTFDDGPNPGETAALLDVLAENDVTATFCVIGQNVQAEGGAALLRRIVAEGHTLCNHSTDYADLGQLPLAEVEQRLKANLAIIREALGDPEQAVPYYRAPNGSFGRTGEVAVALGMQPLGLGNTISDWDDPSFDRSVDALSARLRTAIAPGAIALAHDGGGDRTNTVAAVARVLPEEVAAGTTFVLPRGGAAEAPVEPVGPIVDTDFESGLDGWGPRGDADGDPQVTLTTAEAHESTTAALVSGRTSHGDGIGHDLTGLLQAGTTYRITLWAKIAAGQPAEDLWVSMRRTTGGSDSYDTVAQVTGITSTGWTRIETTYQAPSADGFLLYVETPFPDGRTSSFLVDDIRVERAPDAVVQDLLPLKDTTSFPIGVAIDQRETTGSPSALLTRHADQVTAENDMKPEAWYDAAGTFTPNPRADALMSYARDQDLRLYGHTLVWHSQTPAFFFQGAGGAPLTTSEADKQVLRGRMKAHIDAVAEHMATTYGRFGSDTNPLVAFDVVNEVIADSSEFSDGMRRSEWYRVLGEEFVDLAFRYADEAFNRTWAAAGTDRPVTLFINDYNTEQTAKGTRLHALVERLLARGVPVDGVGHQFHVSLSLPVETLAAAIDAFSDLPLVQAVTELDVTTGTPVTQAALVDQGYYYRDAFRAFRERAERLFSVTIWGLTDGRSWRSSSGAPLLFDDALQGKPSYYGAADLALPARQRTADVFAADLPLTAASATAPDWDRLPQLRVGDAEQVADFGLRWSPGALTARVRVTDPDASPDDAVSFTVGEQVVTVPRSGGPGAVVQPSGDGYVVLARLPLPDGVAEGDTVGFDVRVTDAGATAGWSSPGTTGTLSLVEALSATAVPEVPGGTAPTVDGVVDPVWSSGGTLVTEKQISGTGAATATVRTLWQGNTLHVLAEVADPVLDATGSDPWQQDSVELFVDAGNVKNGPYRYDDTQIRISYLNVRSYGTGDEGFQDNRVRSATRTVPGGYVVEASISLLESGGLGTFHGLDVQVNDATNGARTGTRGWADPTGLGYQDTGRWGVAQLVAASAPGTPGVPTVPTVPAPSVPAPTVRSQPLARLRLGGGLGRGDRTPVVGPRRALVLRGSVAGAPVGTTALVQRWRDGRWRTKRVVVLGAGGSFRERVRAPRAPGATRFRVLVPQTTTLLPASSSVVRVRVRATR